MVRNQAGQAITEAILLMIIFLATTFVVTKYFADQEVLAKLVKTPWQTLSGVLQNGVWAPPEKSMGQHPNTHMRHVSLEGEAG